MNRFHQFKITIVLLLICFSVKATINQVTFHNDTLFILHQLSSIKPETIENENVLDSVLTFKMQNIFHYLQQKSSIITAKWLVNYLGNFAEDLYNKGYPKQTIFIYQQNIKILEVLNNELQKAFLLNKIGVIYNELSQFDAAIEACSQAHQIFKSFHHKRGMAMTLLNSSTPYLNMGNYSVALQLNQQAFNIVEYSKGDFDIKGNAMANIGIIHDNMEKYSEGRSYFAKAYSIFLEGGEELFAANCLLNIGSSFYGEKKYDDALAYYFKAKKLYEKHDAKFYLTTVLGNIGAIYLEEKKFTEALKYIEQSQKLCKQLNNQDGLAISLLNLGSIYSGLGNTNKAIACFLESLKISDSIKSLDNQRDLCQLLYTIYQNNGNFEQAFYYQSKYILYKDSIESLEKTKHLNELEATFQNEKKQQQIELQHAQLDKSKAEISSKNLQRNAFVAFSLLLLLLAIFIYRGYKQKQKANYLLNIQKNEILQQKEEITAQRDEIDQQNQHLTKAYEIIEQKNKNITDSIKYALRIQTAILPPQELIDKLIPDSFVLYKPKSIVSGDFYWLDYRNDYIYIAAVDCTGHGVPGAFMSIVGYNLLNQALNEKNIIEPALILNYLSEAVSKTLRQNETDTSVRDGMDLTLIRWNKTTNIIDFAGVHNPIYLIRNNELIEYKGDKWPINKPFNEKFSTYTSQEIALLKNDIIYMFSDGYMDQFSGETGKKFTSGKFREMLLSITKEDIHKQKELLDAAFESWKGKTEQIDDVMVLGIKF